MKKQTYYYKTETSNVVGERNTSFKIDKNYDYNIQGIKKVTAFFYYNVLLRPFAFVLKHIKRVKVKNKKVLKSVKGGYFVYANHTNKMLDAFMPSVITFPKKPSIVVDSSNMTIKFWGKRLKLLGAVPLPEDLISSKNFVKHIGEVVNNNPVVIYPEAQVWPYYTRVRNFDEKAFRYPVIYNMPCFCFTTTYQKGRFLKAPKVTIFVDGPFYTDQKLERPQAEKKLRDEVYSTMVERAQFSNYEFCEYKRIEDD